MVLCSNMSSVYSEYMLKHVKTHIINILLFGNT